VPTHTEIQQNGLTGRITQSRCNGTLFGLPAYAMAGLTPADVNVAEVHDCFTVMGAIGTEVIGKAAPGQGARYWVDGKASPGGHSGVPGSVRA
jgi:hypothetical protein